MKKFLASLLALTMLCSSVVVFCSANGSNDGTNEGNNSSSYFDFEAFKNSAIDLRKKVISYIESATDSSCDFCKTHYIACITTGVVAVVGTLGYCFRNEIKGLTKKAAKQVKKVFEKKQPQQEQTQQNLELEQVQQILKQQK